MNNKKKVQGCCNCGQIRERDKQGVEQRGESIDGNIKAPSLQGRKRFSNNFLSSKSNFLYKS